MQQPAMFGPVLSAGLSSRFEAEYLSQMNRRKRETRNLDSDTAAGKGQSNGWQPHNDDNYSLNHRPNVTIHSELLEVSNATYTDVNGSRYSTHGKRKENGMLDTTACSHACEY